MQCDGFQTVVMGPKEEEDCWWLFANTLSSFRRVASSLVTWQQVSDRTRQNLVKLTNF